MAQVTVRITQVFMFDTTNMKVIVDKFPGKLSMPEAKTHAKKQNLKFTTKKEIAETFEVDDLKLLSLRDGGYNLERETL